MSSRAITQTANALIANQREVAMNLIEAQCKGVDRLLQLPIAVFGKVNGNFGKLIPGAQFEGLSANCERIGEKVQSQTDALLENYGRIAGRAVDWFAARASEGVAKAEATLLAKPSAEIENFVMPSLHFLENLSNQTAAMTGKIVDLVKAGADTDATVVTETAAAKQATETKHNERKSAKVIETTAN